MGEDMHAAMPADLQKAERFIFLEYFILEEGVFWNSILKILKEKAAQGVEVRVLYDDVGCMLTLPGDYYKTLCSFGIKAICFSRLKGQADNEFNNRSHRKILVIDGRIGYTGGVNIADEYINEKKLFGIWKDVGIRLKGEAVQQLTSIFLCDYELCQAMENAAMRGIDVRIVLPHIPDKKVVFMMTQSHYKRLIDAGVRIFEYEPGFVHAKVYLFDDTYGIVGTVNLDYRSLVHHFENGVWLYRHDVLQQVKADMLSTMAQSLEMTEKTISNTILQRIIRALVRVFSPML